MFSDFTGKDDSLVTLPSAGGNGAPLGKEQKRFNSLVRRIKKVRGEMEKTRLAAEVLHREHLPAIMEAEKEFFAGARSLVLALHENPGRSKLAKKQRHKLGDIMMENLHMLLNTSDWCEDALLKELYQHYDPEHLSYDAVREQDDAAEREMAAGLFNQFFGTDISAEDLGDDARMREKFEKLMADGQAREAAADERRKRRKKTARQLAAEQHQEAAENAVKKTTRQIYLDLVKNFHPDREPDEALRQEKTRQMQEITAAYEAGDQLRLLELQMTLLSDRDHAFAGFEESYLQHFNKSLHDQLKELEYELHMSQLGGGPVMPGNPLASLLNQDLRIMKQNVLRHLQMIRADTDKVRAQIRAASGNDKEFRQFISGYTLEVEDDFGAFGLPDSFIKVTPF